MGRKVGTEDTAVIASSAGLTRRRRRPEFVLTFSMEYGISIKVQVLTLSGYNVQKVPVRVQYSYTITQNVLADRLQRSEGSRKGSVFSHHHPSAYF